MQSNVTCELCETIVNFVKPFVDNKSDEVCKSPETDSCA